MKSRLEIHIHREKKSPRLQSIPTKRKDSIKYSNVHNDPRYSKKNSATAPFSILLSVDDFFDQTSGEMRLATATRNFATELLFSFA